MIIDAWAQHPTLRHGQDPIFDSLRRWTKTASPTQELPVSVTIGIMDQAKALFLGGNARRVFKL